MTSDERREAAENLREIDKAWPTLAEDLEEDPSHFCGLAIAGVIACVGSSSVFRRLADLIDPTCKMKLKCSAKYPDEAKSTSECSRCGWRISVQHAAMPETDDFSFHYCPNCGARVVRGDE